MWHSPPRTLPGLSSCNGKCHEFREVRNVTVVRCATARFSRGERGERRSLFPDKGEPTLWWGAKLSVRQDDGRSTEERASSSTRQNGGHRKTGEQDFGSFAWS